VQEHGIVLTPEKAAATRTAKAENFIVDSRSDKKGSALFRLLEDGYTGDQVVVAVTENAGRIQR
jgi:hypothetical protein